MVPRPPTFLLPFMPKEHKEKTFQIKPVNLHFACHSIWLYFLVQCKWKSNNFRATSVRSENRQFLIGSVYAGNPFDFSPLWTELWLLWRNEGMNPGAKYKKETVQCLRQFHPASGPPGCCSDILFIKGWCLLALSWAWIGLSWFPADTSGSHGF